MADEEKEQATAVADSGGVSEAFNNAMDTIDSDKKAESQQAKELEQEEDLEKSAKETPDTGDEVLSDDEEPSAELVDIDPEVVECCRDYGWDDKKIAQIAKLSPELFDSIREVLDEQNEPVQKEKATEAQQKQPAAVAKAIEEIKFNLDPDIVGLDVKNAIDKIASVLNDQRKGLDSERGQLQSERDAAFNTRIDSYYDKTGLTELGKVDSLTKKQYQLRSELFAHANVTAAVRGISLDRALDIEVNKFKNQGGKKVAAQELIDKLEKQKTRLTNKPTRRLNETGRKFQDEAEMMESRMEEAEREAGLT